MKKAVGYMRVSSQEQAVSGLSLEEQRRDIERLAKRLGFELVAVHEDAGVSGGKSMDSREGLSAALAGLPKGGALLVSKRDRLGRDLYETAAVEKMIESLRGKIVSAAGEGTMGDPDDPSSFLVKAMTDVMAHYERLMGKVRMRAAARAKKARGEPAGFVEFGLQVGKTGKLEDCHEEKAVIGLVLELRALGLSQRRVVAEMERRGVVSPRSGKPLGLSQVQRILKKNKENDGD